MIDTSAHKKVVAIIQARVGSTRLPNKVLKALFGKPILWHVWNRLKEAKNIDDVVIATTTLGDDNAIEAFCLDNNILFFRGSSDDVLSRYYEAAKKYSAEIIVRITADCPVIDPRVVDKVVESFLSNNCDYMSNCIVRTFPRGFDTEVFTFSALENAFLNASEQYEREHVTPFIYSHRDIFSIGSYEQSKDYSFHRWTVDTPEDFRLIEEIYNSLYPERKIFLFDDILNLFAKRPELYEINRDIEQKKLGE